MKKLEDNYLMVGDIHGNFDFLKKEKYNTWNENHKGIIQVGDMGLGFPNPKYLFEPNVLTYFIRGNHDNLQFILNNNFNSNVNFIVDGTIQEMNGNVVLFIGGAGSLDRNNRTIGINWWPDEIPSYKEMNEILYKIDMFQKNNGLIDTVVSHDCPTQFKIHKYLNVNLNDSYLMSMRNFLGEVYSLLNPKPVQWYFGHYHNHLRIIEPEYKTEFILLPSVN